MADRPNGYVPPQDHPRFNPFHYPYYHQPARPYKAAGQGRNYGTWAFGYPQGGHQAADYTGNYDITPPNTRSGHRPVEPQLYADYVPSAQHAQGYQRTPFTVRTPLWTDSSLHPALAVDCNPKFIYDVRESPRIAIGVGNYMHYHDEPATRERVKHLRLISHQFPWPVDVEADYRSPFPYVTCSAVWKALYRQLQEPLLDAEWALLDEEIRDSLREDSSSAIIRAPQRSDWLGKSCLFLGLARDDDFAMKRVVPGKEPCESTWVVKFASRCD